MGLDQPVRTPTPLLSPRQQGEQLKFPAFTMIPNTLLRITVFRLYRICTALRNQISIPELYSLNIASLNNVGGVKQLSSILQHALREERLFALVDGARECGESGFYCPIFFWHAPGTSTSSLKAESNSSLSLDTGVLPS